MNKKIMPDDMAGYDSEQLKFRAQHGRLDWETVRAGNRDVPARLRDGVHAKLWNNLTPAQQDAWCEIERGYAILVAGMGLKVQDPSRMIAPSGRSLKDTSWLVDRYMDWGREAVRGRLSHAMAIAVMVEGLTIRKAALAYRVRAKRVHENLVACLNLYCKMRGWPVS